MPPKTNPSNTTSTAVAKVDKDKLQEVSFDMKDSLLRLKPTESLLRMVQTSEMRDIASSLGKLTSHIYRKRFFQIMDSFDMNPDAQFFTVFMASIVKSHSRVLESFNELPTELKKNLDVIKSKQFYEDRVIQYTNNSTFSDPVDIAKFSMVHIPNCLPAVDIMCSMLYTYTIDRTVEFVMSRPTAVQIHWDDEMQALARKGYMDYWANIRYTNRQDTSKFNQVESNNDLVNKFYDTAASDKYPLVATDMTDFGKGPYSKTDLDEYLKTFEAEDIKREAEIQKEEKQKQDFAIAKKAFDEEVAVLKDALKLEKAKSDQERNDEEIAKIETEIASKVFTYTPA